MGFSATSTPQQSLNPPKHCDAAKEPGSSQGQTQLSTHNDSNPSQELSNKIQAASL